jgi:TetR/AcrR family transcriptional repressor of nem operon
VERYRTRFDTALNAIRERSRVSARAMLEYYFMPYLEFAKTDDKVCLCGALAGEMLALPERTV